MTPRAYAATEAMVKAECIGEMTLKGFLKPVTVYNVLALNPEASQP